jgi:hypothetical protein
MVDTTSSENTNVPNRIEIEDEYNGERKTHVLKHLGNLLPIDVIDAQEFDHEKFRNSYFLNNKPLVIRNALDKLDFGTAFKNWSLDYLHEKCGENKVFVRRNTIDGNYRKGKNYLVQEIEFKSYVKDLIQNNKMAMNSYLAVQNLKKAFPQISDELKMAAFVEKLHAGPFLWIARKDHYEYTHMDPDDNLLCCLRGRKLVRLYGCDVYSMNPNELGSKGRTIQSQIDCDNFDEVLNGDSEIYNKFKNTDCFYCLLKEGDCLYFPAFWWHQVKSSELTISVNVFFGDAGESNFVSKILQSTQKETFMYWIFNIIKQNMEYPSFQRVLLNLVPSLRNFLFKQWHETCTDSQMEYFYYRIVQHFNLTDKISELEKTPLAQQNSKHPPMLTIRGLLQRPTGVDKGKKRKNSINSSLIDV